MRLIRNETDPTRRRMLVRLSALLAVAGLGHATTKSTPGVLKRVSLGDVRRIDAAGGEGWLARDGVGRLLQVLEDGC